jgi:enamine deaminase RidA (YjgF/YER057c/UK114 family)
MTLRNVEPQGWKRPSGYSNGMAGRGELLFVAGQIGWDAEQRLVSGDFAGQFRQALENVVAVVKAAGGWPDDIARLVIYVIDKKAYLKARQAVGEAYRAVMGRHFPAMALVEVKGLLEEGAQVEIEAVAIIGGSQ